MDELGKLLALGDQFELVYMVDKVGIAHRRNMFVMLWDVSGHVLSCEVVLYFGFILKSTCLKS